MTDINLTLLGLCDQLGYIESDTLKDILKSNIENSAKNTVIKVQDEEAQRADGTATIYQYASGTSKIKKDQLAWTQEHGKGEIIYRNSDGAMLTPLGTGDKVYDAQQSDFLYELSKGEYVPSNLIDIGNAVPSLENKVSQSNVGNVTVDIGDIVLPNVQDSEQFAKEVTDIVKNSVKHDVGMRKLMRNVTVDTLNNNHNSLSRMKY